MTQQEQNHHAVYDEQVDYITLFPKRTWWNDLEDTQETSENLVRRIKKKRTAKNVLLCTRRPEVASLLLQKFPTIIDTFKPSPYSPVKVIHAFVDAGVPLKNFYMVTYIAMKQCIPFNKATCKRFNYLMSYHDLDQVFVEHGGDYLYNCFRDDDPHSIVYIPEAIIE